MEDGSAGFMGILRKKNNCLHPKSFMLLNSIEILIVKAGQKLVVRLLKV